MSNTTTASIKLPRCSECGGEVKLSIVPERTSFLREVTKGNYKEIPDDFPIPTCIFCGEYFMIPEVSEPLDKLLKG